MTEAWSGRAARSLGIGAHSTGGALAELIRAARTEAPALAVFAVCHAVLRGAAAPLQILTLGAVVHGIIASDAGSLSLSLSAMIALAVFQTIGPHLSEPLVNELKRRVDLNLRRRAIGVMSAPHGIAHLEDAKVQDLLATAQGIASPWSTPGSSVGGYLVLLSTKLQALGSIALLAQYRWWLGGLVLVGAIAVRRQLLRIWFRMGDSLRGVIPELRRSAYFRDLGVRSAAAKELRIFGLREWFVSEHDAASGAALTAIWRRRRQMGWQMPTLVAAVVVLAGLAAAPVGVGLVSGEIDAAQAVVLGGALSAIIMLGGFRPDADMPIRYGAVAVPALLQLERHLAAKPHEQRERRVPAPCVHDHISFQRVEFCYPNDTTPTLLALDLKITAGTSVALVGGNGAGKTTLVKLLAGLYTPTKGAIVVDGVDLAQVDPDDWRRRLAVIFQDFARYDLSARDNISVGSLELSNDLEALRDAATRAGILETIEAMPRGWESPLSRAFEGGADLSGGEWQRVALARALLAVAGRAQVLILDEPTASLDVRAEAEFYERFIDLTGGLTTIVVSHRFSTVRRADRICVIEGGRIVEDGTHDALLALGGTYARMFNLQAERFSDV